MRMCNLTLAEMTEALGRGCVPEQDSPRRLITTPRSKAASIAGRIGFQSTEIVGGIQMAAAPRSERMSWFAAGRLIALVAMLTLAATDRASAQNCEDGHWIDAVLDDGRLIRLEDGSLWQVDPIDIVTSSIWLPVSNIIICGNRLINEDDNETVHARRLR
jgi:hypothetical protein